MKQINEEKLIDMWNDGVQQSKIAREFEVSIDTIQARTKKLLEDGIIQPRVRKQFNKEVVWAQINDLYLKGYPRKHISQKLNLPEKSLKKYIDAEIANGVLPAVVDTKKRVVGKSTTPLKYKTVVAPSTLEKGQKVRCTPSVSATCVYGAKKGQIGIGTQLCRYSLITNKCRISICSNKACTCYSRISKDNPRLIVNGETDDE